MNNNNHKNLHSNKSEVLFISNFFYPDLGVAAKRIAKFAKYLPDFGYSSLILTIQDKYRDNIDSNLKLDDVIVYKTSLLAIKTNSGSKIVDKLLYLIKKVMEYFLFPDKFVTWIPSALWNARRILKNHDVKVLIASGPSFSSFIIAALYKRMFKKPLILDYRDQWGFNAAYTIKKTANIHRLLDRAIIKNADALIFTTVAMANEYKSVYPEVRNKSINIIQNSFDPDDFVNVSTIKKRFEFTLTYAGNFYAPRSPKPLLQALSLLLKEKLILKEKFRFVCVGNLTKDIVKSFGVESIVDVIGFKPYNETLAYLNSSDALLMVIGNGHSHNIPAKIYEYMALKKPILTICPTKSSVIEIIEHTKCGLIADINNVEDIKEKVLEMISNPIHECTQHYEKILDNYSCINTTRQLSEIVGRVTEHKKLIMEN